MIVFDSYAWFEFFSGSPKGKVVREIIESKEEILTPAICIAEIKRGYLRENKEYESRINFILNRSKILKIDFNIAQIAASISFKNKIHMIDSIIYASALSVNSNLLTGDLHLKDLEKIKFLK